MAPVQPVGAATQGQPAAYVWLADWLPLFVQDGDLITGKRQPHRTGSGRNVERVEIADGQAIFRGAEMVHGGAAPCVAEKVDDFRIQRFAATRNGAYGVGASTHGI